MLLVLAQVIAQSNIAFGTSGARGLVTDFTDEVCAAFAQSFVRVMQRSFSFKRIAIGIDNRPSSPKMAAACAGVLESMGYSVDYYGVLPTPALAFQAMQDKVPAIMVTGSHIPFDRNGLKFYRPDGEITKEDEQAILTVSDKLMRFVSNLPAISSIASDNYVQRYLDFYPKHMLLGKHIGIYEHSSAGRDLYRKVFEQLGASVTTLERTDFFVPIDTEAVSEIDKHKARAWIATFSFDVIFSTDGDGDRPLIADEQGYWLRGDLIGLLCAKALGISQLAVPVSCNSAIELCGFFSTVIKTKIGSPYVIAAFRHFENSQSAFAGFEANGGFILGSGVNCNSGRLSALPTRDALLPVLAILASAGNNAISTLCRELPQRFTASDRIQNIPNQLSKLLLTEGEADPIKLLHSLGFPEAIIKDIDTTDGLRVKTNNQDIIHIRPSGNAPELRVYVEFGSELDADSFLKSILVNLNNEINKFRGCHD